MSPSPSSIVISIILIISLLFAVVTGTIKIQKQQPQKQMFESHSNYRQFQQEGGVSGMLVRNKNMIHNIQELSGDLLISPDHSWYQRSQTISSAHNFLYVWMYNITHRDSRVVIKTLAKEGVQVKMIVEDDKYGPDEEEDPWGRGIQVRNDAKMHTNFIHAKTLVSDNFYVIQTANLTYGGFNDQREYYVIGNDPYILNNLKLLFEKDRRGEEIRPEDIHPNLIVCPIDCREKITGLLRGAKESIYVENQYLEDPEIIDILYSQKHLDLKMIFPKDEDNVKIDTGGLQGNIRLLTTPRIHAKAILIDHKYLVISSINFSTNSLDNNREIGIVLTNKEAINKFLNTFEQDWERAK